MFFIDNPVQFRVPAVVDEKGHSRFGDVSRIITYSINEDKGEQPLFNNLEHVFGPGVARLDPDLWTFRELGKVGCARAVEVAFFGSKFTERLTQLSERFEQLAKEKDSESRKRASRENTTTRLFLAFCEEATIDFFVPHVRMDGKACNAVLTLQLSHGPIHRIVVDERDEHGARATGPTAAS